ncbi:hypothetical protein Ciccas_002154 [Cichlidogyrus casuarinus]|uniref:Kazal-like domain-containing protein n=1 Tax=Cichlidogyrus casuarinus TaxID=1844966 RepID=A0ABD2QI35_9PLAT
MLDTAGISLLSPFIPKHIEMQFRLTPTMVSRMLGIQMLVVGSFGNLLGGMIANKWPLSVKQKLLALTISQIGWLAIFPLTFAFSCPRPPLVGFDRPVPATCFQSVKCDCSSLDLFTPVCVNGTSTFFSPCDAGCVLARNSTTFLNCACNGGESVSVGYCEPPCNSVYGYLMAYSVANFIHTVFMVYFLKAVLESVDVSDKSMGMALIGFMVTFLNSSAPLVSGKFIDSMCLKYRGSKCLFYNTDKMKLISHLIPIIFNVPTIICYVLAWYTCPKLLPWESQTKKPEIKALDSPEEQSK